MYLEYAKNPRWANAEQTAIDLTIRWSEVNEDYPFTASPNDIEPHGRMIFEAAARGDFGPIESYVAPPPPPVPPSAPPSATPLQFFERFTDAEQLAIVTATMTDPVVKLWYDKLLASTKVVFADPRLSAGLDNLVTAGLITAERKAEILPEAQTSGVTVL